MKSYKNIVKYSSFLLLLTNLCVAQILYVDDTASNPLGTGQSWSDAYMYLQDAISNASSGDEIRVAQGVYKPDLGGGKTQLDRYATFNLKNDVIIIGGYAGIGEADPNLRDYATYQSILSGDLLSDDVGTINDASRNDNSYNIVSSSQNNQTATLDGFVIQSGNASLNTVKQQRGGGLYNKDSSPTILNCFFQKNRARVNGGAIFNRNGNPDIMNCTFVENLAKEDGGGIYSESGSPRIEECRFENNSANEWNSEGGGFYSYSGNPFFLNCVFIDNSTGGYGSCDGAGCYFYSGSPIVLNCKYFGNHSGEHGGGIYVRSGQPNLINCLFSGNTAGHSGGGVFNYSNVSTTVLVNCTFSYNHALGTGGGIFSYGGYTRSTVTNCIFWGNEDQYGVILKSQIFEDSPVVNYSCIQNWKFSSGDGNISDNPLFIDYDGDDGIVGTEDDNLKLDQISPCNDAANNNAVPLDIYDLDRDGNYEEPLPIDIINNPRFVDIEVKDDTGLGTPPVVDMGAYENENIDFFIFENLPVQVQEGGIDEFTVALNTDPLGTIEVFIEYREGDTDITIVSGSLLTFDSSNYYIPQTVVLSAQEDSDHFNSTTKFRVSVPSVIEIDVLAIENDNEHDPKILFVDKAAPLWAGVFIYLQEALDYAQGDPNISEIQIAQGIYKPDVNPNKIASFHLINGVSLKGGYAGYGEIDPYERNLDLYTTVLSGDFNDNDVYGDNFFLSRQENAYHVIIGENIDATTSLDGMTITGGYPNDNSKGEISGGGIHLTRSNLLIKDVTFYGNAAYEKGAAIYNENGSPTISNCYFSRNKARFSGAGGAIYIYNYCSPVITDCIFEYNEALDGGAIYTTYHGNFTALNCSFISNFSWDGGAIYMNGESTPVLNNCIFNYNVAGAYDGGAIYIYNCNPNISNCQFNNNSAESSGGAIYDRNSETNLTSCIFINNTAISLGGAICTLDSASYYYNNEFKSNVADFNGGAIQIRGETSGNIEVTRCKFFSNTAKNDGGAIYITGGLINYNYPQVIDCEINNNVALNNGGGIGHRNKTRPTYATCLIINNRANNDGGGLNGGDIAIQNCTIENNISINGGGIANSAVTIENSSISVNSAQNTGGALRNCSGTVKYCEIKKNTSLNSGGGMSSCTCSLYNNLIIGNKALYGGALDDFQGKLQHCTIVHNSSIEGGGIRNSTGSISNCILWENYPNEIVNSTTPTYSCINNWTSGGLGNISIYPEFVDLGSRDPNSTPDIPFDDIVVIGNYHLKSEGWRWDDKRDRWDYDDVTSRCIDSGNPGKGLNEEPLTIPEDPDNIWGCNIRINMGLYGGTTEASIAPHGWSLLADVTNDGIVDISDLIVTAERWLSTGNEIPTDLSRDLKVNMVDYAILAEEWDMNTVWFE